MLKKYVKIFLPISILFLLTNVKSVYADIYINKEMEKPIESAFEYEEIIKSILYENEFMEDGNKDLNSSIEIKFVGDNFKIIYKDINVQNIYEGSFAIYSSRLHLNINQIKKSDKYGFYSLENLDEKISLTTRLNIYDDRVRLNLSSGEIKELNMVFESPKVLEQADPNSFKTMDENMKNVFLNIKSWDLENNSSNTFNHMVFTGENKIQLVDDTDELVVNVAKGIFEFDTTKHLFSIKLNELTQINKETKKISVINLNSLVKDEISSQMLKFYKNENNFIYEIVYQEDLNKYYLLKEDSFKKLTPSNHLPLNNNITKASRNNITTLFSDTVISIGVEGKKLIGEFKDDNQFSGRFLDEAGESVITGAYVVQDNIVNIVFTERGYFNNLETVVYNQIESKDEYLMKIDMNMLNNETLIGSFIETNYGKLKINKEISDNYVVNKVENYKPRSIPVTLKTVDIDNVINGNRYMFTESDVIGGSSYSIYFKEDNLVQLIIRRGNATEVINSKYSLTNNYVEIDVNNKNYNYGKYDNYTGGKKKTDNKSIVSKIKLYPKLGKDRLYFAVDDGSQFMDKNFTYSQREKEIIKGSYYMVTNLLDEFELLNMTKATKEDLEKDFSGGTYMGRYFSGKNETFTLKADGSILLQFTNRNRLESIVEGKYNFVNNKINIEYDTKYYPSNDDFIKSKLGKKESLSYVIMKNGSEYYIQLEEGIYINLYKIYSEVLVKGSK